MKITVTDFQSLASIDIDLEPGRLTAVVGDSNSGKTALVRAVHCVLVNCRGQAFVRFGCKAVSVVLDFGDTVVRWLKSGSSTRYQVDAESFEKFGTGVPEQVLHVLRMGAYNFGGQDVLLTVQRQFDPSFFVGFTGPLRYAVLAELAGLSILDRAVRKFKTDLRGLPKQISLLEAEVADLEEFIVSEEAFLAEQKRKFNKAEDLTAQVNDLTSGLDVLLDLRDQHDLLRRQLQDLQDGLNFVRALLADVSVLLDRFVVLQAEFDQVFATLRDLRGLLQDYRGLEQTLFTVKAFLAWAAEFDFGLIASAGDFVDQLVELDAVIALHIALRAQRHELLHLFDLLADFDFVVAKDVLSRVDAFLADAGLEVLSVLFNQFRVVHTSWLEAGDFVTKLKADLQSVEFELDMIVDELGVCPVCGRPFVEEGSC